MEYSVLKYFFFSPSYVVLFDSLVLCLINVKEKKITQKEKNTKTKEKKASQLRLYDELV